MISSERRTFPRIADKDFAMELKLGEFDTLIHTLNVSASGVYCKIDRPIPLMSRVKLALMVPGLKNADSTPMQIETTGVVVREHPVIIDGQKKHYDIAIFFEDLSDEGRRIIQDYISRVNT